MLVLDPRRLKARLALRGWTQGTLAEKTKISEWSLSRMMRGHAALEEDTADTIAKALRCAVDDFADRYVKAP